MTTFYDLNLSENLLKSLDHLGFEEPTEIQAKTIPIILSGADLIAGSATGSGKTLAFGGGIIPQIHKGAGIQALILTPTRELAEQILKVMKDITRFDKLAVTAVYGGVSLNPQFKLLQKADIVVGTPGRVLDHIARNTIDLSGVKHLVLDEADRMLDMGFFEDVTKIMNQCPKEKQTLLFSATIESRVAQLAKSFMRSPQKVSVEKYVDPSLLVQGYYDVPSNQKFSLLAHLIQEEKEDSGLIMVFCNSRSYTDTVAESLNALGIESMAIHGGLTQQRRNKVIERFHSKKKFVLVCTDVAARGLDIKGVSHVYNYDTPNESSQYVHRIGRTARAGKDGKVINLISNRDYDNFSRVIYDNSEFEIPKLDKPKFKRVPMRTSTVRRDGRSNSSYGRRDERQGGRNSNYGGNRGSRRENASGPRRHSNRDGDRREEGNRSESRGNSHGRSNNRRESRNGNRGGNRSRGNQPQGRPRM